MIGSLSIAQDVQPLQKGDAAPFSGILFSDSKAAQIRKELIEKDGLSKLVSSYERTTSLQDLNFSLAKKQVDILTEENTRLQKQATITEYQRYMWIGLGVLGTSLAVYGAGHLRN